jgi:hypothetical protein
LTDWTERMDRLRARREAAGLPVSSADIRLQIAEAQGTDWQDWRTPSFDYAGDVARYPFQWWPTEVVRVSRSIPATCPCGEPARSLKPSVTARPRYCARCLEPDGLEPEPLKLEREGDPVRVAALYLQGLADALDSPERPKPKKRGAYTIDQKREAVRLYRDTNMTMSEVAEKLGVPLASVKNWVRRYQEDPYFAS